MARMRLRDAAVSAGNRGFPDGWESLAKSRPARLSHNPCGGPGGGGEANTTERVPPSAGADLHPTTRAVLDYVTEHWADYGFSPSVREIQVECELTSTSVVNYHLGRLERLGSITRVPGVARSIVLCTKVPVRVPA